MGRKVVLSGRMRAVADLATTGNRVVDVGCDHGYVSIYLVQNHKTEHVLAMDINRGPLLMARQHVEEAGLQSYITLRLSDGLSAYDMGEADTLICAGMGGRLMQRILEREPDKTRSMKELILQPQSEIADFRRFITDMGYTITEENMVLEEGKFYPVMKAALRTPKSGISELEARFGPCLLGQKHPVLKAYIAREWEKGIWLEKELLVARPCERTRQRMAQLRQDMDFIRQAAEQTGMDMTHME